VGRASTAENLKVLSLATPDNLIVPPTAVPTAVPIIIQAVSSPSTPWIQLATAVAAVIAALVAVRGALRAANIQFRASIASQRLAVKGARVRAEAEARRQEEGVRNQVRALLRMTFAVIIRGITARIPPSHFEAPLRRVIDRCMHPDVAISLTRSQTIRLMLAVTNCDIVLADIVRMEADAKSDREIADILGNSTVLRGTAAALASTLTSFGDEEYWKRIAPPSLYESSEWKVIFDRPE
jgi:hypothetical protein